MFLSFPPPTKMFQFRGLAHFRVTGLLPAGLSHSEISGSILVCKSPELFAAYHVLLRLQEPRHPPYALAYFLLLSLSPRLIFRSWERPPFSFLKPVKELYGLDQIVRKRSENLEQYRGLDSRAILTMSYCLFPWRIRESNP